MFLWWMACSLGTLDAPLAAPASPPSAPASAQLPGYQGRFAADPLLTPLEVAAVPPDRLPFLRNEVFARYGRPFEKEEFHAFFTAQPWYRERPDWSEALLTANDKANVALLQSFEGPDDAGRKALVEAGEFTGTGLTLTLVDAHTAEIGRPGDDLYEWERDSEQWEPRGTGWVITWKGGKERAKADQASLWKVTLGTRSATLVGTFHPG